MFRTVLFCGFRQKCVRERGRLPSQWEVYGGPRSSEADSFSGGRRRIVLVGLEEESGGGATVKAREGGEEQIEEEEEEEERGVLVPQLVCCCCCKSVSAVLYTAALCCQLASHQLGLLVVTGATQHRVHLSEVHTNWQLSEF